MSRADVLTLNDIYAAKAALEEANARQWEYNEEDYYVYLYDFVGPQCRPADWFPYMWGKEARDLWVEEVFN